MRNSVIFSCLILLTFSCGGNRQKTPVKWTKEQSSDLNKQLNEEENYLIEQFLNRHKKWQMTQTGTGLRYLIYHHGEGDTAVAGLNALVNFKISLLNGEVCYSSDSSGAESFLIDRSNVESGLQEGIKYMRVGDKALLLMPSHLAHGLVGDMNKIPPLEPLLFDIELLGLVK